MDLYKKQMMETRGKPFITRETLELISASNLENGEEQLHYDVARVEDPVPNSSAEMLDAPISDIDSKHVEADSSDAADAEAKSAEVVSPPGEEVHIPVCPPPKFEGTIEDNGLDNMVVEPAQPNSSDVEMEAKACEQQEQAKSKDSGVVSSLEIESLAVTTQSNYGDNLNEISNSKNNGDDSSLQTEDSLAFGDARNGPLCIQDGSPKGCEALMPGSKESESIILSRIHHSPESTH